MFKYIKTFMSYFVSFKIVRKVFFNSVNYLVLQSADVLYFNN